MAEKRSTKRTLIEIFGGGLLVVALFATAFVGQWIAISSYAKINTLRDLSQVEVPFSSMYYVPGPPDGYVFRGEVPWYSLASGPPQLVFDKTGKRVDFCGDVGECGPTSRAWENSVRTTGTLLSPDEAIRRIRKGI